VALASYSGLGILGHPGHREIDDFLRRKIEGTPEIEDTIQHIDGALRIKPVPEYLRVSWVADAQAFDLPIGQLHKLRGSIQTELGYMLTELFRLPALTEGNAIVLLNVPPGTPAIYMPAVSIRYPQQLLLARGLSYQITRVAEVGGSWMIFARIPPLFLLP